MLAYRYDKDTKEYLGTQEAQPNPLEGGYLLPANCTFVEPQQPTKGNVMVFENNTWVAKKDHREHYQVKLDDITFSIVDYIGEAKEGYQFISNEVYELYLEDNDRYKVIDGVFTDIYGTPEYEEIKRRKESERVSHLKCTKRVMALMLQELGITYTQLKTLISSNEQAQLEWDLCIELERCNPLLDIMGQQLGLTPTQIDQMFKYANDEVNTLEVE